MFDKKISENFIYKLIKNEAEMSNAIIVGLVQYNN
jgi:hypothetical protein